MDRPRSDVYELAADTPSAFIRDRTSILEQLDGAYMNISLGYLALLGGYLLSFFVTLSIIPCVRSVAHWRGWLDRPDGIRKMHAKPTPTVGGLTIAVGFITACLYFYLTRDLVSIEMVDPTYAFWMGALIMLGVGFYDDVRGLGFEKKLFFQGLVAYLLLHAGYRIDLDGWIFAGLDPNSLALYSIPLTLVWIIGVINAVNLIDGLDGLAAGVSMIAFTALSILFGLNGHPGMTILSLTIVAALAAFLVHNFHPAAIFMGDSGSLFVGFILAAFTLMEPVHANPAVGFVAIVLAVGLPLLDTGLACVRRWARGRAASMADRDHIHHRMVRRMPVQSAVVSLYGVELAFGLAALVVTLVSPAYVPGVLVVVIASSTLGLYALDYFPSIAEREDKKHRAAAYQISEFDASGNPVYEDAKATDERSVIESRVENSGGFRYGPSTPPSE